MKRKLADVLWEAANEHLVPPGDFFSDEVDMRDRYSCYAVTYAAYEEIRNTNPAFGALKDPILAFLYDLGCSYDCSEIWGDPEDEQGVRYMWLLLAMHVAEDEGIEVEVSA